jgi:hypothetical protein
MTYSFIYSKICVTDGILMLRLIFNVSVFYEIARLFLHVWFYGLAFIAAYPYLVVFV